jgi:8-oxo-dGTP diphosphatase
MTEMFYQHTVKTTVAAIITRYVNEQDEVLLTRRGYPPYKGNWCLPGGHIDEYETAERAIIREVREEIGLTFEPRFFSYFDEIIPEKNIHAVVLTFDGPATGDLHAQPGEVLEMAWFSISECSNESLAFHHNQILDNYFNSSPKTNASNPNNQNTS